MEPFTWSSLTAVDPWLASAVHQLRPYFMHNVIENPDSTIDSVKVLIIPLFTRMPNAVAYGKNSRKKLLAINLGKTRIDHVYIYIFFYRNVISFNVQN